MCGRCDKTPALWLSLHSSGAWRLRISWSVLMVLPFHLPPESVNGRGKYTQGGPSWFHTDQKLRDSAFQCIQSWVTALDVRPGDATLTVLRGSHLFHAEFAQRFGYDVTGKEDWHKLATQEELDFFVREKGCERIAICCPAGSLVCWDSRTQHCGQEPLLIRPEPNIRCVVYLCYVPSLACNSQTVAEEARCI